MHILNYETLIDPLLKDVREYTPSFSGMQPGDKVLDVCCGTGAQAIEYAHHGMIATGIDISPDMLQVALKNKLKQKLENVSFCLTDATKLPFDSHCFNYVSVCFGLHDKERVIRQKVVSEMIRVLKQNGALIFIDYALPIEKSVWGCLAQTVEFLVGGEHYRGFQDYVTSGGLDNILEVFHFHEDDRNYLKDGLAVIIKVRVI